MVAQLPAEQQAIYQLEFAPQAEKQFTAAVESGDIDQIKHVAQRFPSTPAGEQAWFLLGSYYMNNRQPAAAAACWGRLAASAHAAQFQPRLSLLSAAAAHRAGLTSVAQEHLRRLTQEPAAAELTLAGQPVVAIQESEVDSWMEQQFGTVRLTESRQADSGLQLSGMASWRRELSSQSDILESVQQRRESAWRDNEVLIPALLPNAVGDHLLVSSRQGLKVFSARTGNFLWGYPNDPEFSEFERGVWDDLAYGQVDSDGERAFLVVDTPSLPEFNNAAHRHMVFRGGGFFGFSASDGDGSTSSYHRLVAIDLQRQGSLRWDSSDGHEPGLDGHIFLGNPLYYGGQLFVIAEADHAIRLLVLDAETGTIDWSQELAAVEHPLPTDFFRQMCGARPILSGSTIVCPTGAGCLVAVDDATRSLSWAFCYPRDESLVQARDGRPVGFPKCWSHPAAGIG